MKYVRLSQPLFIIYIFAVTATGSYNFYFLQLVSIYCTLTNYITVKKEQGFIHLKKAKYVKHTALVLHQNLE